MKASSKWFNRIPLRFTIYNGPRRFIGEYSYWMAVIKVLDSLPLCMIYHVEVYEYLESITNQFEESIKALWYTKLQ